jgi:alpha-tubulin suppressor-like RCC1 family protein
MYTFSRLCKKFSVLLITGAFIMLSGSMVPLNVQADVSGGSLSDVNGNATQTQAFGQYLDTGVYHTCTLLDNSTVKCYGNNDSGQLGYGDIDQRGDGTSNMGGNLLRVDLGTGRSAKAISAGYDHTCVILDNDMIKCWGSNYYGQLGIGDTDYRGDNALEMGNSLPAVDLGTNHTAKAVAAGAYYTCAILDDNTVKCWGDGGSGRLGYGDTSSRGDNANEMGDNLATVDLGTDRTAKVITASNEHVCVILDNNTVKCWGWGYSGILGYGDTSNRGDNANEMGNNLPTVDLGTGRTAKAISTVNSHTCVILDNNTVKCWGENSDGRLGYGDTVIRGDNADEMGDNLLAVDLGSGRTAKMISAGISHTCAILDNDTIKCWGDNSYGQSGYGDDVRRGNESGEMGDNLPIVDLGTARTPVTVVTGFLHTCAILDNNTVKCWGGNYNGGLGYGDAQSLGDASNEMGDNLSAINLGSSLTATALSLHSFHTCVILNDLTVKCWGYNTSGQLGLGDKNSRGDTTTSMGDLLPAIDLGTGRTAKAISAGGDYTCAILDNSTLKCWGANWAGQLGYGDNNPRGDGIGEMGDSLPIVDLGAGRTAKAISAGGDYTCAILDNSTLKCWGANWAGQLGYGDNNPRGDGIGEMGDSLPIVDLGAGRTAKAISAGDAHTCAILDDNTLKCWGYNDAGELGYGDTSYRGDEPDEMGDSLPIVDLGTGRSAKAISTSGDSACAILDNNTVKCWGYNVDGELGLGDTNNRGDESGEMGDNLPIVNLGSARTAIAVNASYVHACVILDNFTVKCWGGGILGYSNGNSLGDEPDEMGDALLAVDLGVGRTAKAISTGNVHTCAILDDNTLKCWGSAQFGQAGYNDNSSRGDEPLEMGDNLPAVSLGSGRTINSTTEPAKIASLNITAGSTQVDLTWTAPNNGGSAITDYKIDYTTNSGTSWTTFADTVSATPSVSITGLSNGTTYKFRATAINRAGESLQSAMSAGATPAVATTTTIAIPNTTTSVQETTTTTIPETTTTTIPVSGAPSAPFGVTGSPGNRRVILHWRAPTDSGDTPITDYIVEYTTTGGRSWDFMSTGQSAMTRVTLVNLQNDTPYKFRVIAVNNSGQSDPSDASARIIPRAPSLPPVIQTTTTTSTTVASVPTTVLENITTSTVLNNPSTTTSTTVFSNSTTTTTLVPRNIAITKITVIETMTTTITRTCILENGGQRCTSKTLMRRLVNYGFSSTSFIDSRR